MQTDPLTGYAQVFSRAIVGLSAPEVRVEVHISNGLPAVHLVGLPETEVRESRERVRSAIQHAGFDFPNRRITINLAPADLPKNSGRFDLPIAIGILVASGQIASPLTRNLLNNYEFVGELSLAGEILPIVGSVALMLAHLQQPQQSRTLVMPKAHRQEASALQLKLSHAEFLIEVVKFFSEPNSLRIEELLPKEDNFFPSSQKDFADVSGQAFAKRAMEIAAAGQHSILLTGSPGVGKSMLAQRISSILPKANRDELLTCAALMSLRGLLKTDDLHHSLHMPAFRSPHHSASTAALIGGGNPPKPGEISLAHGGVLFLDELAEFNRSALEALREPIEAQKVFISRSKNQSEFPARFQLIAAMNPCPCGYLGHASNKCQCLPDRVQRYQSRVSGPLMDRIDLHVFVASLAHSELLTSASKTSEESSSKIRERTERAMQIQLSRQGKPNAQLSASELKKFCELSADVAQFAQQAMGKLNCSGRATHRIIKVARTIADLANSSCISRSQIAEAMQFRRAT